ncbi:hypothetical protein Tco_1168096, partial [Tanacetum coccineum]
MLTQQDIYAASSENRPPMLNKENYVPWSSRLLRYAKSKPNGKLINNFIINGPYVRRMIPEPGDANHAVPVNETFHKQTDDELTKKELKHVEADDQAIQPILLDLPEDIYAAIDSCKTAQEIWLRVQQMMKGSDIGIQEKKAKLFNELERFTSTDGESIESYYHCFSKLMNDLKETNTFQKRLLYNKKEVDDLRAERLAKTHDPLALMANSNNLFNYLVFYQDQPSPSIYMQQPQPNNNNYNPQPSFNQNYMQQPMPNPEDITNPTTTKNMALVLMAKAFKLNYSTPTNNNQRISLDSHNRQIAQPGINMGQDRQMQMVGGNVQNVRNQVVQNAVQNVRNQNGLTVILGIANQNPNRNGNVVAARAEGNAIRNNADLDEIEEVNANCILMASLLQASTSGTQTDKAPVYVSDGSAEVHNYDNCYDNEIFNMFTQEEQYTELLKPILEAHQVKQNDTNVIYDASSMEQDGGTVDQHPVTIEETWAYFESLYNNLAIEVEKVNSVNRKMKETNADLTTKLARYKNQE